MTTLPVTVLALLCAGALGLGLLVGWAGLRLRLTAYVPPGDHREALAALRRRYRRRLRTLRDAVHRLRASEAGLRAEIEQRAERHAALERLIAAAEADNAALRADLAQQGGTLAERERERAAAAAREAALETELMLARERIAAFERDHGLMRIEHEELVAQTARLRALSGPAPAEQGHDAAPAATPRTEIADRDARIHELECELRESERQAAELRKSLQTWKYRIAPLALFMKQRGASERPGVEPAARRRDDDLRRIRGIGRALDKKLRAQGVTRLEQLASMSPAELANLAVRVGVAASRPQRDGWSEQARALAGLSDAPQAAHGRAGSA